HIVRAFSAVNVNVDEAGHEPPTLRVDHLGIARYCGASAHRVDPPAAAQYHCLIEHPIRQHDASAEGDFLHTIYDMKRNGAVVFVLWVALALPSISADALPEWRDLFNGKDLTGWVNVNTAKDTWTVENGMLVCSGKPTGVMRTEKMYENY